MNIELLTYSETKKFPKNFFKQVSEHERVEYGAGNYREVNKLIPLAEKFPEGFLVLADRVNGSILGTTDFYPLKKEAWIGILDGSIREEDLSSDAIDINSNYIYIASVIVAQPSRSSFVGTPIVFRMLMQKLWKNISDIGNNRNINILGVGSTEKGKILLENWGFGYYNQSKNMVKKPRYILQDNGSVSSSAIHKEYIQKSGI